MEYRLVHNVQKDDCHFQKDSTFHDNQQSNTSCSRGKKSKSLVFLAGFVAGVFVTFVICFAMEMIIPHKTAQYPVRTSIVQENVKIDKQVAQNTTETLTSTVQENVKIDKQVAQHTTEILTSTVQENVKIDKQVPQYTTETLTSTDIQVVTTKMSEVFTTKEPYRENGYLEYVMIFIEPFQINQVDAFMYIYSEQNGLIDMTQGIRSVHISKGSNREKLPKLVFMKDGRSEKAVHVQSTVPVIIYGFVRSRGSCDGYMAIPLKIMSRKYIVPSFKVWSGRSLSKSLIGITSLGQTTTVSIKIKTKKGITVYNKRKYTNGETIEFKMSPYETVQLSHVRDFSGSIVTSSYPIGVVSGNKCNSVTRATCNHFIEMILPSDQLDNSYIVPIIQNRTNNTMRILCPDRASVTVWTDTNKIFTYDLEEGDFIDFHHYQLSFISSNGDVLVMAYPHEVGDGDSYMMTIIGLHQYRSDYHFIVPEGFSSFVGITFIDGNDYEFELDKKILKPANIIKMDIQGTTYATFSHMLTDGAHIIRHMSRIKFGLWVYGNRNNDGYGFPAGITYKNG